MCDHAFGYPRSQIGGGDDEVFAFGLGANVDGIFSVWDGDGRRLYAISFLPSPYDRMLDKNVYKKNLGGTWRAHAMPFGEWHWGSDSILFLMEGRPKSN